MRVRSSPSAGSRHDVADKSGRAIPRSSPPSIEEAWEVCSDLFSEMTSVSADDSPKLLGQELLFCLLGGFGVSYELNRSAAGAVAELDPFAERWSDEELLTSLTRVLDSPSFEPRRRDGSLRRYRFPRKKAALIVDARYWLLQQASLSENLMRAPTTRARRELLCDCPGIGLKTASWILRNTGWGDDLAILDVHVVRALTEAGRIGEVSMPRDYEIVEVAFLEWCRELGAPPAAFDLFVWEWQRGTLALP